MSDGVIVARLRRLLLALAGAICAGAIVELWMEEHYGDPVQWIPFILSALGALVVAAAWFRTRRATLLALRGVMAVVAAGSFLGIYEHVTRNLAFELEIRPNAAVTDVLLKALHGASPIFAPGILALAAILAVAATYYHPALRKQNTA